MLLTFLIFEKLRSFINWNEVMELKYSLVTLLFTVRPYITADKNGINKSKYIKQKIIL